MTTEPESPKVYQVKKLNVIVMIAAIIGFIISIVWILICPVISFSNNFSAPKLMSVIDKNIATDMAVTVEDAEIAYATKLQNLFCEIDEDDLQVRLQLIENAFTESGLTFNVRQGDTSFHNYNNQTIFGRLPTMIYGVWHPTESTGSATSIILSTELNFNSTVNPKADENRGDCNFSIPSPIVNLLSITQSLEATHRLNHDIVIVIYLNKYSPTFNNVITKQDITYLLTQIQRPLFSLHLNYPKNCVSFTEVFSGYKLEASALNGKNANMDLVALLLKKLPIMEYENISSTYSSYLKSLIKAAFSRYSGIHQNFIKKYIPAVTLTMNTRIATLNERTQSVRNDAQKRLFTDFKGVVESLGSVEKRIIGNAITYIPLFSANSRDCRFVFRNDILYSVLLMLAMFAMMCIGGGLLKSVDVVGGVYCGFVIVVAGGYTMLMRSLTSILEENRLTIGLCLFIFYFLFYSYWFFCRVVFNNFLIQLNLCTDVVYKKSILSVSVIITSLFSYLYLIKNPFIVIITLIISFIFFAAFILGNNQNCRYILLMLYSTVLSLPFLLMINNNFGLWVGDFVMMMKDDSWMFSYLLVVFVGNLGILHYVNGMGFSIDEKVEEMKLKQE